MFIDSSNEMLTNEKLLIVSDVVNGLMRERERERGGQRVFRSSINYMQIDFNSIGQCRI